MYPAAPTSEDSGVFILSEVRRWVRALDVPPSFREDLASDCIVWLLEHREPGRHASTAWIRSVTRRFVQHWRGAQQRRKGREEGLVEGYCFVVHSRAQELSTLIRCAGQYAPVLQHVAAGAHWADACRAAGYPRGSHSWLRRRMRMIFERSPAQHDNSGGIREND